MVNLKYLSDLIDLCRTKGISSFHGKDFSLKFHVEQTNDPKSTEKLAEALKEHEMKVPPDLRADDTMNFDKILNWSGSPDGMPEMPLVGDLPLV